MSGLGLVQLPFYVADLDLYIIVIIGEFGIVHRAHLVKNSLQSVTTIPVAVKMMKGIAIYTLSQWVSQNIRIFLFECSSSFFFIFLFHSSEIICMISSFLCA